MKKNIGTLGILTAIFLLWASQGWAATLTFDSSIHGESSFTATVDGIKVTLSNPETPDGTATTFSTDSEDSILLSNGYDAVHFDISFDQTVRLNSIFSPLATHNSSPSNLQHYFTISHAGGDTSGQHSLLFGENYFNRTINYIPGTLPILMADTSYAFDVILTHDPTVTPAIGYFQLQSINFSPIPEPGTMTLLSLGLILGHGMRNRGQTKTV